MKWKESTLNTNNYYTGPIYGQNDLTSNVEIVYNDPRV